MRFRRAAPLALLVTLICLASACGSAPARPKAGSKAASSSPAASKAGSKPLEKASLRLDWVVSGYHAPFYLALEKGYYKAEGIDLTIGAGNGAAAVTQDVGNGRDTFGLVDAGVMMKEVSKGVRVRMVMGDIQKNPMSIIAAARAGIKAPKDLVGKRVAFSPGEGAYLLLPAYLKRNGLLMSQLHMESLAPAAHDQALLSGKVDADVGFGYIEVPALRAKGLKVNSLSYAASGINVPSLGIIATDQTLSQRSGLVKRFLAATIKGFKAAEADPAAAIAALAKENPNVKVDKSIDQKVLERSFRLLNTTNTQGHPFGWMSAKDWTAAQALLVKYEGIKPKPNVDAYFTNQFLPRS